jgi:hypothetical protein
MNKLLLILLFAGLFSACGAQPEPVEPGAVQTAIAQTLMAEWTATFTPRPTNTITPTWTPTATATETPTPTFTDTPTMTASPSPTPDLRVIDADPSDYMLTESDLPQEGNYYLHVTYAMWGQVWYDLLERINPNTTWFGHDIDPSVLNDLVDGWHIKYTRGITSPIAPQYFIDSVILFTTVESAQRMAMEFGNCNSLVANDNLVDTDLQIGDVTWYCTYQQMETTGYRGSSIIEFTYRNFYHQLIAYGWEREVTLEVLEAVARNLLAKLEIAPLSDAVTFQP